MTLRVLHIYSGNLYGGIETLLSTLARHREVCPEMEPHFALVFEGQLSAELAEAQVPVTILGATRVSRPISLWRARRALQRLLAREQFDVAICHSPWPHALFGPVVRRLGVPLVFYMHNSASGTDLLEWLASRVRPDLVLVNSRFTATTLPRIHPGVPSRVFLLTSHRTEHR